MSVWWLVGGWVAVVLLGLYYWRRLNQLDARVAAAYARGDDEGRCRPVDRRTGAPIPVPPPLRPAELAALSRQRVRARQTHPHKRARG